MVKVKISRNACLQSRYLFSCWSFSVSLMIYHHKLNCCVCYSGIAKVKVTAWWFTNSQTVASELLNLLKWWCTIMSQCYAKRVMCFHGQCHSQGSNNQTMIVSTITTKVLILLQTNLVWWCIAISQSVFLTDWIAVPYKIKITAKILNIVCLSAVSFLYRSLFATKVGVLMYYYWQPDPVKQSGIYWQHPDLHYSTCH